MIGYEIAINDQSPVVVTSPDVASVMVHSNYSFGDSMYVGGLDTSRRIVWIDEKLKVGDRIRIKVVEVSAVSNCRERKQSGRANGRHWICHLKLYLLYCLPSPYDPPRKTNEHHIGELEIGVSGNCCEQHRSKQHN